jgi:magnesium chelatase family protein
VEEAKERVKLAIRNSGLDFPDKKIIVNLAPADQKKEGPLYDLPIAIGILEATGMIDGAKLKKTILLGELSLSGDIKLVKTVIQAAELAKNKGFNLIIPELNKTEAGLIEGVSYFAPKNLEELFKAVSEDKEFFRKTKKPVLSYDDDFGEYDFSNIVGQFMAKRALEIAATGGHNILFFGSPGGGKTLLSRSIVSILPELSEQEMLEVTKIYSVAGLLSVDQPIINRRPFLSPHHTTSPVAIIGGGTNPKPGAVSLAHKGVLFLDEFPEFPRSVLEALRQPLEDRTVTISRAQGSINYPADFMLVASENPCPCGYYGDPKRECSCSTSQIIAYHKKISGPMLDRIDLHLEVEKIPLKQIKTKSNEEPSSSVRARVKKARQVALSRSFRLLRKAKLNSSLSRQDLSKVAPLDSAGEKLLEDACDKLDLSMRQFLKIQKIARTIADLEGVDNISISHLSEALQYRSQRGERGGI